jgi:hypothetical protein
MEAFIRTFSKLTDEQLKELYYELRNNLAEVTGEFSKNYPAKNDTPEQLDRGKKMDLIGLQIEAVSNIVKSRRS